ncbi:type I-E CRISPR-associated protein Cas5/CasD [Nocardia sp. NPDC004085]
MTTPAPDDTAVLLLRLAGPLQAWGESSRFNRRDTRPEPTKSGVVGLLAAALGRPRDADVSDLAALTMGVRIDQPGSLARDYHTVSDYRGVPLKQAGVNAKGHQKPTSPPKNTHITVRYYLQDAAFLVALAGPTTLIQTLSHALRRPAFPLALGRRSCPPTQPIHLGVRETDLLDALATQPWIASGATREEFRRRGRTPNFIDLGVTLDDPHGGEVRNDAPVSFDARARRFAERRVRHLSIRIPTGFDEPDSPEAAETDTTDVGHDPFALLGW